MGRKWPENENKFLGKSAGKFKKKSSEKLPENKRKCRKSKKLPENKRKFIPKMPKKSKIGRENKKKMGKTE